MVGREAAGRQPVAGLGPGVYHRVRRAGDPRNLLRVIEAAAETAGAEDVGVHTLRHSVAVGWLESGVHIKAVADLLGHSSISITGDVYGHTTDTAARGAVDGWSGALGL
jgi:site-specific recombinase XerD